MLDSVTIHNFKCFADIHIPLKPLSVFSGINGVGKSSALQALLLLRQSLLQEPCQVRLNGPLVSLGYAEDVLHEYAGEGAPIRLILREEDGSEQAFSFPYAKGERELELMERPPQCSGALFNENFAYLNAERIGPRTSFACPTSADKLLNVFGNSGEYCAWVLALHEGKPVREELCHPSQASRSLRAQVEAWMSEMGQTVRIHLNEYRPMDCVSLQFSFLRGDMPSSNYRPTNVGFGLTYALPVFVAPLLAKPGALLCIENPEAHLHPKAQTVLGGFLARAAAAGIQTLVETHSDHVLNGIRIAARRGIVAPEQVALNFFHKEAGEKSTSILTPTLDKYGRVSQWPAGFFDEWENNLAELL